MDIDVFADDANAVIRITDTGPGVPEDALDRVFNPFFGLAAETVEGSGLGCRSRSPLLRNMVVRFPLRRSKRIDRNSHVDMRDGQGCPLTHAVPLILWIVTVASI